jgi:glycosyltransferase involved in cell wall biosynthesis
VTSQTTSITVIIPTYNEELNIARAVRQVLDEPWPATCELGSVIVVDDCSADGTRAIAEDLARQEPRVAVVRNAQRSGKNAGVRAAVAAAHSDIIAVVDADVLFSHGCLSKTISLLIEDPNLMGASCIIKPLPAQSWQERASRSQALLVATLKRQGHAYLSAVYAIKAPAFGALNIPDGVADDAYITCWLRSHNYRYAVQTNATAYIRAATGLRDFAKQTLRGRRGDVATRQAVSGSAPVLTRGTLARALIRSFRQDPLGFFLYVAWYAVVISTPTRLWLPSINLSTFDSVTSTKDVTTCSQIDGTVDFFGSA